MTTNEPRYQLEWFIRARSGVDSGEWDWGISLSHEYRIITTHAVMTEGTLDIKEAIGILKYIWY